MKALLLVSTAIIERVSAEQDTSLINSFDISCERIYEIQVKFSVTGVITNLR